MEQINSIRKKRRNPSAVNTSLGGGMMQSHLVLIPSGAPTAFGAFLRCDKGILGGDGRGEVQECGEECTAEG